MPTSSNGRHPRSRGRSGAGWERARQRVLRTNQICQFAGNDKWPPCFELIDMSLKWPHPYSATVDHPEDALVKDLEWNDPRLYKSEGLAPMHLVCNQRKGDGRQKPQGHPQSRQWLD